MTRVLCSVLALSLLLQGCGATEVNEHRTRGAPPSVTVRPYWTDTQGERHLVGGIECRLLRDGDEVAVGRTDGQAPLVFQDVEPGQYELVWAIPGVSSARERFELRSRRRITVRIELQGTETTQPVPLPSGGERAIEVLADAGAYVLKAVGTLLLVFTLLGLVVVVSTVLDTDDDDDDEPSHGRDCWCRECVEHRHEHRR